MLITPQEKAALDPNLLDPIEYRKSGLSLNHIVGCPLDCGYCIRHIFGNFNQKKPVAIMTDEEAVTRLINHKYFKANKTPIQIFNRATDPMLPSVKNHTLNVLTLMDSMGLTNHVLIITRWKVDEATCNALNQFKNIKLSILVTYSGIKDRKIEPVDSNIAAASLITLFKFSKKYRVILYWRPIITGINDKKSHLKQAAKLSKYAHATVFSGLFLREEINEYFITNNIPSPYPSIARRKILPKEAERRIIDGFREYSNNSPIFRKTSCGVSFAHQLEDYNGHFGIRELCDICPKEQIDRCQSSWSTPSLEEVAEMATSLGGQGETTIDERAITVSGIAEPGRYFMQHKYGYQVHDSTKPHLHSQHGRSGIGWENNTHIKPQ